MTRSLEALRLLLGAVMVVTAVQYFMPFLLPFVPAAEWNDPMARRLMTAFDRSGLLAVARFIHLVAGALLLSNRAVPFALAALMPVNLCALFIALFIEGGPAIAALAVLIVALNALLMLAYLPYYRGVLEGGQLADGEGPEDGQNFESLFVNPLSDAPTGAYLGGALVLAAALAFYWFVVPFANGTMGLLVLAIPTAVFAVGLVRASMRKGS
jgi:hypothetical protein